MTNFIKSLLKQFINERSALKGLAGAEPTQSHSDALQRNTLNFNVLHENIQEARFEIMGKKLGISLRIEESKIEELDQLAESLNRDRSFVINEAIENYLEVQKWQIDRINAAIKQANKGQLASEANVQKVLKKWRS